MNKYIIKKIKEFLLELFFPCFCLGCKKEGNYLCEDCRATLEISEFQYCLCNKNPLLIPPNQKLASANNNRQNGKCGRCSAKKLSGLYFALPYKENSLTRDLIWQFKYQPYVKELAKTLAGLLIEHFVITNKNTEDIWENSILMPIPLDKNKLKKRGYNQSEELAKELSKILQVSLITNNLIKTKITLQQVGLSEKQREENIKNAFLIKNPEQIRQLGDSGKKIFLVDDVYTTGSTMEECTRVLKETGAKQVWGIAVAREG